MASSVCGRSRVVGKTGSKLTAPSNPDPRADLGVRWPGIALLLPALDKQVPDPEALGITKRRRAGALQSAGALPSAFPFKLQYNEP